MNENVHTVVLWHFLHDREGWGRQAGKVTAEKLRKQIDARPGVELFRISLQGMKRLDTAFAAEALISVIKDRVGKQPICLVDLPDADIAENLASAAGSMKVPVTTWKDGGAEVLGAPTTGAARHALAFALARPEVRAADYARAANISINNASTRFNKLWTAGCLLRSGGTAPSGGKEFVYRPIGPG